MRDLMGIMKQAQAMQEKMAVSAGRTGGRSRSPGASGGGSVRVTMTAKGQMKGGQRSIRALMVADEREILEDLIVAACQRCPRQGRAGDACRSAWPS